jgi:sugar lactone lactonase YvrE
MLVGTPPHPSPVPNRAQPSPLTAPAWPPRAVEVATGALDAALLDARDDVATALRDLSQGTHVAVTQGTARRAVELVEAVALGHKFALHAIGEGRRIRKYGEYIGRVTRDVPAGAWVHVHNLATTALRTDSDERAWRAQAPPPNGVRALGTATCIEGASPVYDRDAQRAYWLDAAAPVLHAFDVLTSQSRTFPLPGPGHVIAPLADGTLALVSKTRLLHFDPASGTCVAKPLRDASPDGTRWTGAIGDDAGRLWCVATDLASAANHDLLIALGGTPAVPQLARPTGLALAADGRTLLVVEAARASVRRHAIDAHGAIAASTPFADASALPGDLWGAALDAEGGLWTTLREAGCVLRFAPDGSLARVVCLPVAQPTGCAFAGPGLRELVVTTAADGSAPLAGRTLSMDVGVAGLPPRCLPASFLERARP